ncbi:hypothetical protein ANANG_G00181020 [Anguilla anguilla]|uniref:Cathepsin propeptide inhibitor domain-containing protein n=1 Tax=Anguilla anguilla TaxID=7936 RepID=A0A9D3M5A6_ANGAN|nr:hypothetical protein ANANG_G00181020 [Anguilla anguilla]
MHALQNFFLLVLGIISHASSHLNLTLNGQWKDWKDLHNKEYGSQGEESQRRQIWEKNLRMVEKHNMEASYGLHSFTMGLNHLSDMMAEEVNAVLNGLRDEEEVVEELHRHGNLTFTLPDDGGLEEQRHGQPSPRPGELFYWLQRVDWRSKGMVPPRPQSETSALGAMEGLMKRQTGKLVPLSPQNLLDCSSSYGNMGCRGGYLSKTFRYIIENKGIDSDSSYPYESRDGEVPLFILGGGTRQSRAGHCSGFQILRRGDERALQLVVANVGPVSVGINALMPSFHSYSGGESAPNMLPKHLSLKK